MDTALPLKVRMELINCIGDLGMQSIQQWYDWRLVGECYKSGDLYMHTHCLSIGLCIEIARQVEGSEILAGDGYNTDPSE